MSPGVKKSNRRAKHAVADPVVESLQQGFDSLLQITEVTEDNASRFRFPMLSPNQYAHYVLESYKQIRGSEHTDYQIVQPLGCYRVLAVIPDFKDFGLLDCCHVSFTARSPRKAHSNEVIFFGELVDFCWGSGLVLINFAIREPHSPGITNGCGFCPNKDHYPHPHDSYFAGRWDFVPTTNSSQKQNAVLFAQTVISNRKYMGAPTFNLKYSLLLPEPFEDLVIDPSLRAPELSASEYAELALEYFKKENGIVLADYDILEPLGFFRFLSHIPGRIYEVIDWCHVSFTAKPRKSDSNDDILLFFAELADFSYEKRLTLNYCSMTKPDAPGITYGCGFCPPDEKHPHLPGAYYAGLCDHKPSSYISQEEITVCFQRQVISKRNKINFSYLWPDTLWTDIVKRCFIPRLSDKDYAVLALTHISEAEGAEYELVNTMYSHLFGCRIGMSGFSHWCHVCFSAKPENSDAPPVHFFAELNDIGLGKFRLHVYSRMDLDVGTEEGCGRCPISKGYPHPKARKYIAGSHLHYRCVLRENHSRCSICSDRKFKEMPEKYKKNPSMVGNGNNPTQNI